jgi:high affinity sulfate transporter 1
MISPIAWLRQHFPYSRDWLGADLLAGLTVAAVVIPKAMAYAGLAGLPAEIGLYTVLVPMAVYAVLGTSAVLSVSTTTTLGILTATALQDVLPGADQATLILGASLLALLVGVLLLLAALLRLGLVADFISDPVLTGFKSGIGLAIIVDQMPKLIGVHIQKGWFGHNVLAILQGLPHLNAVTTALGLGLLVLLLVLHRWAPRLPAPIIAIGVSLGLVALLALDQKGVELIGTLPPGLPQMRLPDLSFGWVSEARDLLPAACGIALMSFTETIAAGRAFASAAGSGSRISANRELVATGFGNLIGGLFGAMPAGGGTTQTAVNQLAGARSSLASAVTAAMAAVVLLFLAPLISHLPQTALAAVVIFYSVSLIKPRELLAILTIRRMEFLWAVIALVGVISFGTMQGIMVAVAASILALARQTNNPPVYELARKPGTDVFRRLDPDRYPDETFPGLLLLRAEGRMYFANSQTVIDRLMSLIDQHHPRVVLFDMSAVFDIEYTALKALTEIDDRLTKAGIVFWLSGLNPEVLKVLARSALGQRMDEAGHLAEGHIGKGRLFHNPQEAVAAYFALPGPTAAVMSVEDAGSPQPAGRDMPPEASLPPTKQG